MKRHPHNRVKCWENMKTHAPRCPKNTFPEFFHITLSLLHLIANGLSVANINSMTSLWRCCKFMCSIFSKAILPFGLIKPNIIQKLPINSNISVKLMEVWSCIFGNLRIRFFKLAGSIVKNMERINTRKRNTINSSAFKVLR